MMSNAPKSRPILIYGAGIHLSGCEKEAIEYAERINVPVVPTWGGLDLMPSSHPLHVGSFGTHGTRAGNFAVQNATHITAIGTRLDSKATGTPIESFAREAEVVMVDIDQREINKFKGRVIGRCMDAKEYLSSPFVPFPLTADWRERIDEWKKKYPVVKPEYRREPGVNPYVFLEALSEQVPEDAVVCTDTGCAVAWVSQVWKWKKGQRFIHAFNQTPMGYGLPAAIGAYYAGAKSIVLITGDGSLMMNIGELATVSRKKLPIHIYMFNNQGHAMCRQTQREWLGSTYPSTSIEGGLSFPNFTGWAWYSGNAGIPAWIIKKMEGLDNEKWIRYKQTFEGPLFCEIEIDPNCDVVPKVKYGYPNEDGHPLLPREEFNQQMIVKPWIVS
jgi:acetolactate synthase-1/2/3 large subunit